MDLPSILQWFSDPVSAYQDQGLVPPACAVGGLLVYGWAQGHVTRAGEKGLCKLGRGVWRVCKAPFRAKEPEPRKPLSVLCRAILAALNGETEWNVGNSQLSAGELKVDVSRESSRVINWIRMNCEDLHGKLRSDEKEVIRQRVLTEAARHEANHEQALIAKLLSRNGDTELKLDLPDPDDPHCCAGEPCSDPVEHSIPASFDVRPSFMPTGCAGRQK